MRSIVAHFKSLIRDENAQATIEYILMLSIMVALIVSILKKVLKPLYERAVDTLSARIRQMLFGNMHQIPFRG